MKAYELLFFVAPSIDEETRLAVMKRIDTAITADNGTVDNVDNWGKRKLAYEVNGLITPSSISTQILKASQSWIVFCALPTLSNSS